MKFTANQSVNDKFFVTSISTRKTKRGDTFWVVELAHPSGIIPAKVWNDALPQVTFKANTVAYIEGRIDEYKGVKSLVITQGYTLDDENSDDYLPSQTTPSLVFDIETVGQDFDELDPEQQEYLIETLERNTQDPEEAKKRTGLHALFGFVVAIGAYSVNQKKGTVIYQGPSSITPENKDFSYIGCSDEKELLEKFWSLAEQHERFITYNGNRFDLPFLLFRSAVQRVKVPFEINNSDHFIDLMKKLRPNWSSAYRLDMVSKALGITNPKEEGVSGAMVGKLYKSKQHQKIVDYVIRDVIATHKLYIIWKNYLAGKVMV